MEQSVRELEDAAADMLSSTSLVVDGVYDPGDGAAAARGRMESHSTRLLLASDLLSSLAASPPACL